VTGDKGEARPEETVCTKKTPDGSRREVFAVLSQKGLELGGSRKKRGGLEEEGGKI